MGSAAEADVRDVNATIQKTGSSGTRVGDFRPFWAGRELELAGGELRALSSRPLRWKVRLTLGDSFLIRDLCSSDLWKHARENF